MKPMTRRDLLKTAAAAVGGTIFLNRPITSWAKGLEATSKVVLVRNQQLFANGNNPDLAICRQMLDQAL